MEFLQKIKNGTTLDPVIPLLGIHPKNLEIPIQNNLCTPMFIAALFTTAKKTVVHLHNKILHSRKKEGIPTFCDSMDGTREYYAK